MNYHFNQSFSTRKPFFKSAQDYVICVYNNFEYSSDIIRESRKDLVDMGINHRYRRGITKKEIKELLRLTENGVEDICNMKKMPNNYENMKLDELCQYLEDNPKILKGFIVTDGFNIFSSWKFHAKEFFMKRFESIK